METVARNMGDAIALFHPIAMMNREPLNQYMFFDVENGSATCGFRRQVANWGVCLCRAQYARGSEVDLGIGPNGIMHRNGLYHYTKETYEETNAGLFGKDIKEGKDKERVNNGVALNYIQTMKEKVAMTYSVDLCPDVIHQFVNDHFIGFRNTPAYEDRKINFFFTASLPVGHMQAKAERDTNGDFIMISEFKYNGKKYRVKYYVHPDSIIPLQKIQQDRIYLIAPKPDQDGVKTCNVIQTYKTGIRIAVQHFERGLFRPGHGDYEVTKSATNNVKCVMDHPFMPDYNDKWIENAPKLVFDLDLMASIMNTLKGYPRVTMKFRDSSSGVYFKAEAHNENPEIEIVLGQTIQYVRGRIWTP